MLHCLYFATQDFKQMKRDDAHVAVLNRNRITTVMLGAHAVEA